MLPSEDHITELALKGDVNLEYFMAKIKNVKDELAENIKKQPNPNPAIVSYMLKTKIINMHAFMCHVNKRECTINNKRTLIEQFTLEYWTRERMMYIQNKETNLMAYKIVDDTSLSGKSILISLSFQDVLNLANSFIFNMKQLETEYYEILHVINYTKRNNIQHIQEEAKIRKRSFQNEIIPEQKLGESSLMLSSKLADNEEIKEGRPEESLMDLQLNSIKLKRETSEYIPAPVFQEADIFKVISNTLNAMNHLKKVTDDMKKSIKKAVKYAGGSKIYATSYLSAGGSISVLSEEQKSLKSIGSQLESKLGQEKNNTTVVIERINSETDIIFDCVKIVSYYVYCFRCSLMTINLSFVLF